MRILFALALLALSSLQPLYAVNFLTEENPPLNFNKDGKPAGIATAVVTEMAKRAGVPAQIELLPWSEAYSRAQGEADTCVYSTARLATRNNQFQWVGPITRGYWSAFALEGFSDKIAKVDDLKQYRIGVTRDARAEGLRQRGFTRLLEVERDRDVPAKLTLDRAKAGGVDVWVTQGYSARDIAREAGAPAVREIFSGINSQDYWLACNNDMPKETVRALTHALTGMFKDGSQRKLSEMPRAGN